MTKDFHLMGERELESIVNGMAYEIMNSDQNLKNIVFIGIIKRGDLIATRVASVIEKKEKVKIPIGRIDINLYRDDLSIIDYHPQVSFTDIPDINEKIVFLFDDVFFTGRTIRSALNEIMDFGRPKHVFLYVLVDRKSKELPIVPDFSGTEIKILKSQNVKVHLKEIDNADEIILVKEEH